MCGQRVLAPSERDKTGDSDAERDADRAVLAVAPESKVTGGDQQLVQSLLSPSSLSALLNAEFRGRAEFCGQQQTLSVCLLVLP